MVSFPNAKINIGLNVVAKRADGYHDLETVFYPVKINDVIEVIESDIARFTSSGIAIPGDPDGNLCLKAIKLLQEEHRLPALHVHLHKNIPVGSGTGGGSADAAFILRQLNGQFELGMNAGEMERIAGKIGADCPFFIRNEPVFAAGRGDEFEMLQLDLSGFYLVLVNPGIHVSTAAAFTGIRPRPSGTSLKDLVKLPISSWPDRIKNDFEETIFPQFPEIAAIRRQLYQHGAVYASMSGSGSSVYGIFNEKVSLPTLEKTNKIFYGI